MPRDDAVMIITARGMRALEKATKINEADLRESLRNDFIPNLGDNAINQLRFELKERGLIVLAGLLNPSR
jgi:hypothetical protein